jgi:hypothetical protein
MNAKTLSALPKAAIRFIEPMYARLVNELPPADTSRDFIRQQNVCLIGGTESCRITCIKA